MKDYMKYLLTSLIFLWLLGFWYMIEMGGGASSVIANSHQLVGHNSLDMRMRRKEAAGDSLDLLVNDVASSGKNVLLDETYHLKVLERIRRIERELQQLNLRNKENDFIIKNLRLKEKKFLRILSEPNSLEKSEHRSENSPYLEKDLEQMRRKIFNDLKDLNYFVSSQLSKLSDENTASDKSRKNDTLGILKLNFDNRFKVLLAETYNYSVGGHLGESRRQAARKLSAEIQNRLWELQNPSGECDSAKKLICDLTKGCGFGCQMHHILYCMQAAFYTKRTLVLDSFGWQYNSHGIEAYFKPLSDKCIQYSGSTTSWNDEHNENEKQVKMPIIDSLTGNQKFLPLSVPKEYVDRISKFHGEPFVWWSGQLMSYIMRYNTKFQLIVNATAQKFKFSRPCVGVHIRRTDKIGSEAAYHSLDEYMQYVDEFFKIYELRTGATDYQRTIYLASDEPNVFKEAHERYANMYRFVYDERNAQTAQLNQRYTPDSAQGIILDVHFLSQCDYLVCTFSSQVCRMAYELMQTRYADASWRFRSLDDVYYFGGQNPHNVRALFDHKPTRPEEIELKRGDLIGLAGNHWNGYSKGRNRRTNQEGLFPSYKVADVFTSF